MTDRQKSAGVYDQLHAPVGRAGRRRPWRIVRWYWKLLYAVAGYLLVPVVLVEFIDTSILQVVGPTAVKIIPPIGTVAVVALVLVGARIFRGKGEPVDPPRAWWRMTSRPKLSRRLGVVGVVAVCIDVVETIVGFADPRIAAFNLSQAISILLGYGLLAFLYINSGIRLKRLLPEPAAVHTASPVGVVPAGAVTHALPTSRVRVTGLSSAAASAHKNVNGTPWLLTPAADDEIAVTVDGNQIGWLRLREVRAYAAVLRQLPGPLVVKGLRTGDRLWVELPDLAKLGAAHTSEIRSTDD